MTDTTSVVLSAKDDDFFGPDEDQPVEISAPQKPVKEAPVEDDDGVVVVEEDDNDEPEKPVKAVKTDRDESDERLAVERRKKRTAWKEAEAARREAAEARREVEIMRIERDMELIDRYEIYAGSLDDQLASAYADGDPDKIRAAQRAHTEAQQKLSEFRQIRNNLANRKGALDQARGQTPASPYINELAAEWGERNADWFNPTSNDPESAMVRSMSVMLAQSGIPAHDPRHYEMLDERLSAALPHRYGNKTQQQRKPGRPPTSGGNRTSGAVRDPANTVRIPKSALDAYRKSNDYAMERSNGKTDGQLVREYAAAWKTAYPQGR